VRVAARAFFQHHVDVGIVAAVLRRTARADLQQHQFAPAPVLDVMAVRLAGREGGAVASLQELLARVGDQHALALQHIDELVLHAVPVPLARPLAGRQAQEVDAELGQPGRIAQLPAPAVLAAFVEGRGVAGAEAGRGVFDVDLGHLRFPV
jgi:hypothetical protein